MRTELRLAVLLVAVGLLSLAAGCKKPRVEPEREFTVKRFPRLNPEESLVGTWEWGFNDINYSLPPNHWQLTIPEQLGVRVQFKLHADGGWEWQRTGTKPRRISGPRYTVAHVNRDDGYGRRLVFDSLTLIDAQNKSAVFFYYRLCDTCLVENGTLAGLSGGPISIYYLRERE